jgi:hypothetical protein
MKSDCCQILMKVEVSRQIFAKHSNIKFHEILPVRAELFRADGRADMPELIVAFRNFTKAPKHSNQDGL